MYVFNRSYNLVQCSLPMCFTCILPSFCHSIFGVISKSALTPMCDYCDAHTLSTLTHDAATSFLLPSTLYCQCNSITTHHHHSHARYQACMSCKWLPMMAMQAQLTATHRLGSKVYFFLFVSSFYKLTNCNLSFLGSILLVMTGTNAAQPMPTPTCTANPSSPSKWDVRGLG